MFSNSITSLIDLTLLDINATIDDILMLSAKGTNHQVAALCIFPQHLTLIPEHNKLKLATVINFPSGEEDHVTVLEQLDRVISSQLADEIDYVFPYQTYLSGQRDAALSRCFDIYQRCKQHHLLFKVILETGALPTQGLIYQLSQDVIHSGCDFLKTSTGKIAQGASIEAATSMLRAIMDSKTPCGLKISGGIKTQMIAKDYIKLAEKTMNQAVDASWFRIGTSRLWD